AWSTSAAVSAWTTPGAAATFLSRTGRGGSRPGAPRARSGGTARPGRWRVGSARALWAEVVWVKRRGGRRFVVLGAGMNDLLRPALYRARHRIVAVRPRPRPVQPATRAGPVCAHARGC